MVRFAEASPERRRPGKGTMSKLQPTVCNYNVKIFTTINKDKISHSDCSSSSSQWEAVTAAAFSNCSAIKGKLFAMNG